MYFWPLQLRRPRCDGGALWGRISKRRARRCQRLKSKRSRARSCASSMAHGERMANDCSAGWTWPDMSTAPLLPKPPKSPRAYRPERGVRNTWPCRPNKGWAMGLAKLTARGAQGQGTLKNAGGQQPKIPHGHAGIGNHAHCARGHDRPFPSPRK